MPTKTEKISKEGFEKSFEKFEELCRAQIKFGEQWHNGKCESIKAFIDKGIAQQEKYYMKKQEIKWKNIVENIKSYAEKAWGVGINSEIAKKALTAMESSIKEVAKDDEGFKERLLDWKGFILDEIGRYRDERDAKLSITSGQIDEYLKEEKNKDFAEALKLTKSEIPLNVLFFTKIRDSYLPKSDTDLAKLNNNIKTEKKKIEKQLS